MPGGWFTTGQAAAALFFKTAHPPLGPNRGMTELYPLMTSVAREFKQLVQSVGDDQLAARTPCTKYDVRALVNHLLYWGPWLEAAARKEPPPTETRGETEADLTNGEWAAALEKRVDGLVDAFGLPGAWEGTTTMGGGELPASMVGEMVFGEFVVHTWDLAKATGGRGHVTTTSRSRRTRRPWAWRSRDGRWASSARRAPSRPPHRLWTG
jgi:uncharacterized protein (TIGR03086 family)